MISLFKWIITVTMHFFLCPVFIILPIIAFDVSSLNAVLLTLRENKREDNENVGDNEENDEAVDDLNAGPNDQRRPSTATGLLMTDEGRGYVS